MKQVLGQRLGNWGNALYSRLQPLALDTGGAHPLYHSRAFTFGRREHGQKEH